MEHREVVVDFTISMIMKKPIDWNKEMIEFHYNESSWCADNLLKEIENWQNKTGMCLCCNTRAEYVREATQEDKDNFYGKKQGTIIERRTPNEN